MTVFLTNQSRYNRSNLMMETIMKRKATYITLAVCALSLLSSCSFNPFTTDNHETGSPVSAAIGAGIGGGSVALLRGHKFYIGLGSVIGGAVGYYVSTLRYASGGVIQGGGKVYQVGEIIGIYIPTDNMFDSNTDVLLPQAFPILDSVVAILRRYPNNNILISGNTSGFYRGRWEQGLSERRAQRVAAYLWNAGISDFQNDTGTELRRLNYVGYGDYFPISSDITNKGIRENSRIQITSYPSNCDLFIGKRDVVVRNMGATVDDDIGDAPACTSGNC